MAWTARDRGALGLRLLLSGLCLCMAQVSCAGVWRVGRAFSLSVFSPPAQRDRGPGKRRASVCTFLVHAGESGGAAVAELSLGSWPRSSSSLEHLQRVPSEWGPQMTLRSGKASSPPPWPQHCRQRFRRPLVTWDRSLNLGRLPGCFLTPPLRPSWLHSRARPGWRGREFRLAALQLPLPLQQPAVAALDPEPRRPGRRSGTGTGRPWLASVIISAFPEGSGVSSLPRRRGPGGGG